MGTLLPLAAAAARSPFRKVRPDARPPKTRVTLGPRPIARDHLAAYARICGFRTTGHPDEAGVAGGPGRAAPLPPTYPHVLGFPAAMRLMTARDFPLPLLGLVHTWIALTRHAPLGVDDRPEITVHTESLSPHRRGTEATLVTEARLDGELVWESRSGYLARHPRPGGTPDEEPSPRQPPPADPLPETASWDLAADLGRRYGSVSGDRNPIHLHPLTARAFGFPRAIAHGMWTFARCLAELDQDGEHPYAQAAFKAPVLLPGTVSFATDGQGRFQLRRGERLHLTGFSGETSARCS
ncbi:MaoC/PaaZ C-terminal domain-containing protein [Streptomyces sp. NPDC058745]|uniref:MaoC/PaaZ C-terminal domain-containing protein n=1 Tax=unclassified Streptomyces TaxID=2593676 RepID=UPI0036968B83